MKLYDISQEIFSASVFPGDPAPQRTRLHSMTDGDPYNLTAFSMCAHNGTHIDAPAHFLKDGITVEQIPLSKLVGEAYLAAHDGTLTAADAARILSKARAISPEAARRILIKGRATVSLEAAATFADVGIDLIGNESQAVGPENAPLAVHERLLSADVVLLEGIRLAHVPTGVYLLAAQPLNLGGAEGAPCRAILMELPSGARPSD